MTEVKLDSKGIGEFLKTSDELARAVHDIAEDIASRVRAIQPAAEDVVVDDYVTDRVASSVTIRDTRGRLWQVQDGLLTRAAASAGLEVTAQ